MKYKKKVDKNQPEIVKQLRQIGYTVELDKDDILVGKHGKTAWIEIKEKSPFAKNGKLRVTKNKGGGGITDSQYKILWNWNGQYNICWNIIQIKSINDYAFSTDLVGITPQHFRRNYKEWLTESELNRLRREKIIQDGVNPDCPFERFMDGLE